MADQYKVDLTDPNFNAQLVTMGVTGSIHYAPHGAPAPKGMEEYQDPWVNMGWLSEEGISEAISRESNSFTPWQTNSPVRDAASSEEFTFNGTLWTIGGLATAMRYGIHEDDMEFVSDGEYVEFIQGKELPEEFRFALAFDIIDGSKHRRFILPNASVSDPGEVTYNKDGLVGYPMTWRANFDQEAGYSVLRRFKEGWRPGQAGVDKSLEAAKVRDLGDWSDASLSAAGTGDTGASGGSTRTGGNTGGTAGVDQ